MTEITKLEVGKLETNCYVVSSNGVAFVVDPGAEAERIFDHCNSHSLKVEGILLTHGHYDHSGAVKKLQNLTGAKIYATAECDDLANSYKSMAFAFGAIINKFDLRGLPAKNGGKFYQLLAAYGHMGRTDINVPWEQLDKVDVLKNGACSTSCSK